VSRTDTPAGHVELDRTVTSIRLGRRHREDLGDLEELAASIDQLGLLQPITISPDGTLLCGARRLAAVKRLGWRRVSVWVRGGVSDRLQQLLAEQTENTVRKPYTPREAAALYRELKALLAEDAARRQAATRFGHPTGTLNGPATVAAPSRRTSRAEAARLVTGRDSHTTLERVGELERIADDPDQPDSLRDLAAEGLLEIEQTGKVAGVHRRIQQAAARPATSRANTNSSWPVSSAADALRAEGADRRRPRGVRAFVLTWTGMHGWDGHYDAAAIGPALTDEQWTAFNATVQATVAFAAAARNARQPLSPPRGLATPATARPASPQHDDAR
jgi:ParB family transcriptional regulator, chromosome partitioning protein